MEEEIKKAFSRRIASANKVELVVIIYDIIEEYLRIAEGGTLEKEIIYALGRARLFVNELIFGLDMQYGLSKNLLSLYIYINRCINFCIVNKDRAEIEKARAVLLPLKESFYKLSKEKMAEFDSYSSQKIYAGLTYGKNLDCKEELHDKNYARRGYRI